MHYALIIKLGIALAFSLTLASCIGEGGSMTGIPSEHEAQDESPNFDAAWVHTFNAGGFSTAHGDIHRLSDGTYSILHMPGGERMEVVRLSEEGMLIGTRSFAVPRAYTGCPFMPNEETFVDDSAILSYGGTVFRVDLFQGRVLWTAEFSGQLQHSARGFWVDETGEDGLRRIRPLDVDRGVLESGFVVAETTARRLLSARVVYEGDEGTDQLFTTPSQGTERRYLIAYAELTADGQPSGLLLQAVTGEDFRSIEWSHRQDLAVQLNDRPDFAIYQDQLFMAVSDKIVAVDLTSGEQNWTYSALNTSGSQYSQYTSQSLKLHLNSNGSEVRFWDGRGGYHRVSTEDGRPLSRTAATNLETSIVTAEPIGDAYFLTANGMGRVDLIDAESGSFVRTFRGVSSRYHAPAGTNYDAATNRLVLVGARAVYALQEPATNVSN